MGLFSIFGTSLRALNAYAASMGVIANNISNSSNENYSRQQIALASLAPETFGGIEIGRGVVLDAVQQVVDKFVELRLNDGLQDNAKYEALSTYLGNIEGVFNETDGGGLSELMNQFFNAWSSVGTDPENRTVRANLVNVANTLVEQFHSYATSIDNLRNSVDLELSSLTSEINAKLVKIKDLNQKILESNTGALTYKDERRKVLNELSEMIDINIVESGVDGAEVQIYTKSGQPLVNGVSTATFSVARNVANDNLYDLYVTMGGAVSNVTSKITGGRVAGLIQARDTNLKNYKNSINDLAYRMVTNVNTLHSAGFTLGATNGQNFFNTMADATNAATNISLHANILSSTDNIAASSTAAGVPGNNIQANAIAALADSTSIVFASQTNSFSGFLSGFLSGMGTDASLVQTQVEFRNTVIDQIKQDRTQVSGVNVDEEQINLVKYQAAYEASGRMIKVADQILQTLIDAIS